MLLLDAVLLESPIMTAVEVRERTEGQGLRWRAPQSGEAGRGSLRIAD